VEGIVDTIGPYLAVGSGYSVPFAILFYELLDTLLVVFKVAANTSCELFDELVVYLAPLFPVF